MNQKKRTRAGTIALYVLAVLLLCYGVYMMYSAYDYVSQYYAYQGMDIGSNLAEAVQYMVSQSYLYLCFALLFYVAGVILQKLNDLHACLIPQEQPETADAQEAAAETDKQEAAVENSVQETAEDEPAAGFVEASEEAEEQEGRPADEGEDTQEAEANPKAEDEDRQEEDKQDE